MTGAMNTPVTTLTRPAKERVGGGRGLKVLAVSCDRKGELRDGLTVAPDRSVEDKQRYNMEMTADG